ncbi:MAG TPA: hypothetical protein VEB21_13740 [Terriglobales bacterium]|nr:hypothetical protein [Terriglobales bacterium]
MDKCRHDPCNCDVSDASPYCSLDCAQAAGDVTPEDTCECPHDGCDP